MDPQVFELARQLQAKLAAIDEQADVAAFQFVHELSIKLIACLEAAMPALREKRGRAEAKADRDLAKRLLKEMRLEANLPDDSDSLEQIERELGGEDPDHPVGVPARRKPGPRGLVGGVALPLPESDSKR